MTVLSRRERTAQTRKTNEAMLLQAVIDLLEEGIPYAEMGIEQIVRKAGFSRPTFYTYFEDKRALVMRLGETVELELAEAADPWLSGRDVPLRSTLLSVLEVFRRNRAALGAIVEASTYDEEVAAFWRGFHERFIPGAEERIAAGNDGLAPGAVAARAFALVWMTERVLVENVTTPTVGEEDLLDQVTWFWATATGVDPS